MVRRANEGQWEGRGWEGNFFKSIFKGMVRIEKF